MDLQTIKNYFGDQMVTFPETTAPLTEEQANILYNIGLPNYNGYGGTYKMLDKLELIDDRYLRFGTREDDEEYYFRYLDLETGHVVFQFLIDDDDEYELINTSLESYLVYIYVYIRFARDVKLPQKLGQYWQNDNHRKYARELKRRLLEYNEDAIWQENKDNTIWTALIEEMEYGVI